MRQFNCIFSPRLLLPHLIIPLLLSQQLLMCSSLYNTSLMQYQDLITFCNRAQSMPKHTVSNQFPFILSATHAIVTVVLPFVTLSSAL